MGTGLANHPEEQRLQAGQSDERDGGALLTMHEPHPSKPALDEAFDGTNACPPQQFAQFDAPLTRWTSTAARPVSRQPRNIRLSTSSATTLGSASVEMSPSASCSLAAILRRIRRMILPERVFGSPGAHWM